MSPTDGGMDHMSSTQVYCHHVHWQVVRAYGVERSTRDGAPARQRLGWPSQYISTTRKSNEVPPAFEWQSRAQRLVEGLACVLSRRRG